MKNSSSAAGYCDPDSLSPLTGDAAVIVDCMKQQPPWPVPLAVVIGIDEQGQLPDVEASRFDILLTAQSNASAPWVFVLDPKAEAARLLEAIQNNPFAASTLLQLLRLQERLQLNDAIKTESFAYSTLLGGEEFSQWLKSRSERNEQPLPDIMLKVGRSDDEITITLDDPEHHNAISAPMRDALFDILLNCQDDPTEPEIVIKGSGKCFSVGGSLPEFGSARDPAKAHIIRVQRSIAALLYTMADRTSICFHGACIGSGLEVFVTAGRRTAHKNAWFQLPELAMGLIPGAGGTVTVTRAIGRHRAAWMMVSGKRIKAQTALDWGLVHEIIE